MQVRKPHNQDLFTLFLISYPTIKQVACPHCHNCLNNLKLFLQPDNIKVSSWRFATRFWTPNFWGPSGNYKNPFFHNSVFRCKQRYVGNQNSRGKCSNSHEVLFLILRRRKGNTTENGEDMDTSHWIPVKTMVWVDYHQSKYHHEHHKGYGQVLEPSLCWIKHIEGPPHRPLIDMGW